MFGAMRLGRLKPTAEHRRRALPLARYMTRALPPAPPSVDNTDGAVYRMYANDRYGDCTCAGLANYFTTVAAREGSCVAFDDQDVIDFYFGLSGGRDEGLIEVDVLEHARLAGFPLSRAFRLAAWVRLNPRDLEVVRSCAALFWCLYVGAELPRAAQSQALWSVAGGLAGDGLPGSWGGHAMVVPAYDPAGPTFITWGGRQRATWGWWDAYVDEAYALLDVDRARQYGVDMDALLADLHAAGGA